MKKIRSRLAAIALLATMSGPVLLGIGAGSLANAAAGASFVSAKSTRVVAFFKPWCPVPGALC